MVSDASQTIVDGYPRTRDDLSAYQLDDELVVFDPQTNQTYMLNTTGHVVWELCDGERSCEAIADEVAAAFNIDAGDALPDVVELISAMRRASLLST